MFPSYKKKTKKSKVEHGKILKKESKRNEKNKDTKLPLKIIKSNLDKNDIANDQSTNGSQNDSKKKKALKKLLEQSIAISIPESAPVIPSTLKIKKQKLLKSKPNLRQRMLEKLKAAKFRYLNEQLYCSDGKDAMEMFKKDPESFHVYHEGYKQQLSKWPVNPINVIIEQVSKMPKTTKIADLGCGEAILAKSVEQNVRSFDLVSTDKHIEECDMAHTPLLKDEMDVVVFCLALMGKNLTDFIVEANRILKVGGIMKIAEVESRFENIDDFIKYIVKFGFKLKKKDFNHNMFYFMDFEKERDVNKRMKLPYVTLKPCLYKKR